MELNLDVRWQPIIECFASSARLEILRLLSRKPMSISELAAELVISSPIVTRHIAQLEQAGLVTSQMIPGKRGTKKMCSLCEKEIRIVLSCDQAGESRSSHCIGVGEFELAQVEAPCGMMSNNRVIGLKDDPRYFQSPDRTSADVIWFSQGELRYHLGAGAAMLKKLDSLEIRLSMEMKAYRKKGGKATLIFELDGQRICTVEEKADGAEKERPTYSYRSGEMVVATNGGNERCLTITRNGTWYGNARVSDFTLSDITGSLFHIRLENDSHDTVLYLFGGDKQGIIINRQTLDV